MTPLGLLAGKTSSIRLATGIVQLGARTPAMLAMQSMSLQMMSGGRFILGVGSSGPRIMEGWHGVPFSKPVQLTRETIDIVRMIARGDRLEYEGELFQLPPDGFGRSIRSLAPACEPIPMYVASLGPRNLELTGEIADGWLGNAMMPEAAEAFLEPLRVGCERGGRSLTDLDLVMPVAVEFTDDVEEASRRHADGCAFTIGAMGAPGKISTTGRLRLRVSVTMLPQSPSCGMPVSVTRQLREVPIELGFKTNLLGPADTIKERLRMYRGAGITSMQAKVSGPHRIDIVAQLIDVMTELNAEPSEMK